MGSNQGELSAPSSVLQGELSAPSSVLQGELSAPSSVLQGELSNALKIQNYDDLINKPTLNGATIIGDMEEIDPTVPDWSKASTKPTYTAEEVGAVGDDNAIPLEELALLF